MAIANLAFAVQNQFRENLIQSLFFGLTFILLIYLLVNEFLRAQARLEGLGGPGGLPLIGNLWDIRFNAAEKYRKWSQQYGAVYQIQLGNIPVVVVNTAAAAKVIFGHNSQALASRPEFYTFHKVCRGIQTVNIDCFQLTLGSRSYPTQLERQ